MYCVYLAIRMGPYGLSQIISICTIWKTSVKHMANLSPIRTIRAIWVRSRKQMDYVGYYVVKIWAVWQISGLANMGPLWRPWTKLYGTYFEIPSEPQICVIWDPYGSQLFVDRWLAGVCIV